MASWLARALARGFKNDPLIAVVHLRGVIAPPGRGPAGRGRLNADRARPWLNAAFRLSPAAVALRINSPGGSPAQTELLVADIRRRAHADRKRQIPIYAFAEDVAASGGQWLLSGAADAGCSYALPTSIVGSIGVTSPSFGAVVALQKVGLERRLYTAGRAKGGLDPFRHVDPAEAGRLEEVLTDLHASFIGAIKASRGPALAAAPRPVSEEDLFSGRVWTGRQAAAMGLIDGLGGMREILSEKFGPATRFVECGERVGGGGGLFGLFERGGASSTVADAVAVVAAGVPAGRVGAGGAGR